jgi:hypothetical protein
VLLVLAPLASLSLAGQEHGRTIPLADVPPNNLRQRLSAGRLAILGLQLQRRVHDKTNQFHLRINSSLLEYVLQVCARSRN